jgi:hypothetical protein
MPTLSCPGGSAPLSGADKTVYSASTAVSATAGAIAQMKTDADRDADSAANKYSCLPKAPCRECQKHVSPAVTVQIGIKVSHWSLINVFSRLLDGDADYTATVEFTWTSVVSCDCRDN